ncbi:MAG: SdpI family protein [Oscillospiraceae bacterium]|nr:SdpI family protein [Oscillospiraceae bacterium]
MSFFQDFDFAKLLPEPEKFMNSLEGWIRFFVLLGPLLLLGLGIWYYYYPPKEANYRAGFRTYFGMGSVEAWLFAQKLAGKAYLILGGGLSAVMLVISLFFSGKNAMATVIVALICVIVELVLVIGVWVLIYMLVYRAYDKDGNRRK